MNILSMQVGRDGCSGYRALNPLKFIDKNFADKHQAFFVESGMSGEEIIELIKGSSVIVFRQQHDQIFKFLMDQEDLDVSSKLLVFDLDDDIYNITPFSDSYRWGGVEEVMYEGDWLWKDGEKGFDIARNKEVLSRVVDTMKKCDLITCTTQHLKDRVIEISGNTNVEVLPNAIDFKHWKKWPLNKGDKIRIGWTGGSTHYIDWHTIKDSLKEIFDKYDNIELVIQGNKWDGTLKGIPYEYHNWIDFEGHPYKTASLNLDIAIIPLKETLFNRSKSCIKWYEFSSLGVPCVVSNVLPYSEEIEGRAIAYNTQEEFKNGLSLLIENAEKRKEIADKAYEWVKENRDLSKISQDYINIFEKYLKI